MSLLDHFRPPIFDKGSWEGFHGMTFSNPADLAGQRTRHLLGSRAFVSTVMHGAAAGVIFCSPTCPQVGNNAVWHPHATSITDPTTPSNMQAR